VSKAAQIRFDAAPDCGLYGNDFLNMSFAGPEWD
jgi:hypothetical protein